MSSLNKVFLVGNMTRDPELRYTQGGTAVCEFGVACNRKYKDGSGEMQEEVFFGDVTAWGRMGENVNEYMSKGRSILVEGYLKLDQWETDAGEKRSKVKIVATNIQFLGGGQQGDGGGQRRSGGTTQRGGEAPPATSQRGGTKPSTTQRGGDGGLNMEDIPF